MSRIGKEPIDIPSGVEVTVGTDAVQVKGPKGTLSTPIDADIAVAIEDGKVVLSPKAETRRSRSQHGLRRTLLANCIEGVSKGYAKTLEVIGVGYKVDVQGKNVVLNVGFSHPVMFALPTGIEAKTKGAS